MGRRHRRLGLPLVYEATEAWKYSARCLGREDLFFPEKGQSRKAQEAILLCAECPVLAECKAYAERTDVEYGVWGGRLYQPPGRPGGKP